jgi:hypothetical protein
MPDMTLPHLQACRIRVTNLDPDGTPTVGVDNLYVSDALVSMGYTPVYEEGDEITEKNACGGVVVNYVGPSSFKRGDVSIQLSSPDPFLGALLGGGDVITVAEVMGFAAPPIGQLSEDGISIEIWVRRILAGSPDPDYPYGQWVYPMVRNLRLGEHTHGNETVKPNYTGNAFENPNWGDGPDNAWPATSDRVYQWFPVTTLPALSAGAYGEVIADVP